MKQIWEWLDTCEFHFCRCHEAYKKRNMVSPECDIHDIKLELIELLTESEQLQVNEQPATAPTAAGMGEAVDGGTVALTKTLEYIRQMQPEDVVRMVNETRAKLAALSHHGDVCPECKGAGRDGWDACPACDGFSGGTGTAEKGGV